MVGGSFPVGASVGPFLVSGCPIGAPKRLLVGINFGGISCIRWGLSGVSVLVVVLLSFSNSMVFVHRLGSSLVSGPGETQPHRCVICNNDKNAFFKLD